MENSASLRLGVKCRALSPSRTSQDEQVESSVIQLGGYRPRQSIATRFFFVIEINLLFIYPHHFGWHNLQLAYVMKRIVSVVVLMAVSVILLSCSNAKLTAPPLANISGAWEFLAVSNTNSTSVSGIEVALKEGQVLVNGVSQPDGQISASGSAQIVFITLDPSTSNITAFGGSCVPNGTNPSNDLSGSVSSLGGSVSFSYHEAGNLFTVNAELSGDGQSMIGTFTAQSGSNCNDSGTITGTVVPKLSGTYSGQLILPGGTTDTATATLSQNSSGVISVNLVLSGTDNTTVTLTGPVTAHAFAVQGTFKGQNVLYCGYYELILDTTTQTSIPSLYFVNTTNPSLPVYAGTLSQPTP